MYNQSLEFVKYLSHLMRVVKFKSLNNSRSLIIQRAILYSQKKNMKLLKISKVQIMLTLTNTW